MIFIMVTDILCKILIIFFKKIIRSFISGSIAQFLNFVSPLEKQAAIKTFSVAPTDIFGNYIAQPLKPFFAEAKI